MMTLMRIACVGLILLFSAEIAKAEIYTWLDKNGVRYYSNTAPPQDIETERRSELPFDEAAYESRRLMEQEVWEERQIRLEATRNSQLEKELAETKAKLAEAASKAQEASEAAKQAQELRKERTVQIISPCLRVPPGKKPIPYPKSSAKRRADHTKQFRFAPLPSPYYHQKPFSPNHGAVLNPRNNQVAKRCPSRHTTP